jgi:hypothetical protein
MLMDWFPVPIMVLKFFFQNFEPTIQIENQKPKPVNYSGTHYTLPNPNPQDYMGTKVSNNFFF